MAASMSSMESSKQNRLTPKKLKHNIKSNIDDESPTKKQKLTSFNEIEFKMLLKDNSSKLLAVEKFVGECALWPKESTCDIVSRYCSTSPQCVEIIQLLEQHSRKPGEVALIMEALEKILMRIADDLTKFQLIGQAIVRQLLAAHLGAIYSLLAMRNKSNHMKAALKLLTAVIMQGEAATREMLLQFDFQHNVLAPLLNRRDRKDTQDVRTCYLHFIMAFLMNGDTSAIRQLVETKGFLNGAFPGLVTDKFLTLQLVLPTILDKIVQNPTVPKTSKIRLFNDLALKHLSELYRWKCPGDWRREPHGDKNSTDIVIEDDSSLTEEQEEIRDMVHQILLDLCCSLKHGINFWDRSCATSGKNQNHVITKLLTSLPKPYMNPLQASLVCKILKICPDQIHWFLPTLKNALSPRPSAVWIRCMDFLCQVYSNQADVSISMVLQQSVPSSKMVAIVMNQLFPPKDVWSTITSAIKKDQLIVRHYGVKLSLVIIQRVAALLSGCHSNNTQLPDNFLSSLTDIVIKTLPSIEAIYNCWRSGVKPKSDKNKDKSTDTTEDTALPNVSLPHHLQLILQLLCCYQDALPLQFRDHHIDYNSLLEGVRVARQSLEEPDSSNDSLSLLQLYLLRLLVETDARQFNWTKENVGGRSTLYLLLEMVVSTRDDQQANKIMKHLVHKLFLRTGYFYSAEDEVSLWLDGLVSCSSPQHVTNFMDKAIGQLLKTPYSYLDKVQENTSVAASFDVKGGGEAMEISSMGTNQALLESILSIDEVSLLDDESLVTQDVDGSTSSDTLVTASCYSFSPLVPAVLDKAEKLDLSEPDVLHYIEQIICQIMHRQGNPVPLCHLVRTNTLYPKFIKLHASVERWTSDGTKMKKTKSPRKSKLDVISANNNMTLSELLLACFEREGAKTLDSDTEAVILEQVCAVSVEESVDLTRQLLLYLSTAVLEFKQKVTRTTDLMVFYGKVLNLVIEAVIRSKNASAVDAPNAGAISSAIDAPNIGGISSDFSMLRVHAPKADDILRQIFVIILDHDVLRTYFLEQASGSSRVMQTAAMISLIIAQVVTKIPELMDVSAHLKPYLEKISSNLEYQKDVTAEDFLKTVTGFVKLISSEDLGRLTLTLLESQEMKEYLKHPEEDNSACKHLMNILEEVRNESRLSQHSIPLLVISCIAMTAVDTNNKQLLSILTMVMQTAPTYSIALNKGTFECLLEWDTSDCDSLMQVLLSRQVSHRHWFLDWLENSQRLKKKQARSLVADNVVYYLQGCTDADACKSQMIYKAYWTRLCLWLTTGDRTSNSDTCITLLCCIIQLSKDTDELVALVRDVTSLSVNDLHGNIIQYHMTALRHLTDRLLMLQTHSATDVTDDTDILRESVMSCMPFGVRCLVHLLTDKTMRKDADLQELVINNLLHWSKDLKGVYIPDIMKSWKPFVIQGLRNLYTSSLYLSLLGQLLASVYHCPDKKNDHLESVGNDILTVTDTHTMVLSHSQFMTTMLSPGETPCKAALVDLMVTLTDLDLRCCQTSHLSVLFGAYGATLSISDQKLLQLFNKYEQSDCQLTTLRPYMWGTAAIDYHMMKTNLGPTLYKSPSMEQIIDLLNKEKLSKCALKFPLLRKSQLNVQDSKTLRSDLDLYDPCFLLPLFSHLLASENIVNCFKFVEHNCLSYVLAALSCHDETIRATAYLVLARYHTHLEGSTKFRERHQILYILTVIKNSIEKANAKLPCIITVFLAKAVQLMLKPGDQMYQVINAFLLLKPAMDLGHVPEFYMLFNSSAFEYKTERSWILSLLEDGLQETQDFHIYERRHTFRIVLSFYESAISDQHTQVQVLKLVRQACSIKSITSVMVKKHGLLNWLGMAINTGTNDPMKACQLVDIIHVLWFTLLGDRDSLADDVKACNTKHQCLPVLFTKQIMMILQDLLLKIRSPSLETFHSLLDCLTSLCCHAEKTSRLLGAVVYSNISLPHMLALLHQWALLNTDVKLAVEVEKLQGQGAPQPLKQIQGKGDKNRAEKTVEEKIQENTKEKQEKVKDECRKKLVALVSYCKNDHSPALSLEQGSKQDGLDTISAILMLVNWSLKEVGPKHTKQCVKRIIDWFWCSLDTNPCLLTRLLSSNLDILQCFLSIYDTILYSQVSSDESGADTSSEINSTDTQILISALNRIFIKVFQLLSAGLQQSQSPVVSGLTSRLRTESYQRALKTISHYDLSQPHVKMQNGVMSFVLEVMLGGANCIK